MAPYKRAGVGVDPLKLLLLSILERTGDLSQSQRLALWGNLKSALGGPWGSVRNQEDDHRKMGRQFGVCFECGEQNPFARECPRPLRANTGSCFNCGDQNHWFRDCPQPPRGEQQRQGDRRQNLQRQGAAAGPSCERRCYECHSSEHLRNKCPQRIYRQGTGGNNYRPRPY